MRYLSRVVASVLVLVLVAVESQGTPASAAGTIALNKSFVDVSIETNLISVDIELVPGYNLVAIPLSFTTTTRARDIAVAALPGGVQLEDGPITAILRWDVSYTAWLSNQPDVNNFEIEATRGYFIRLQSRIPGDKLTLTGRRYGSTPPHPRVTSTSPLIISGSVIAHQSSTLTTVDRLSFQVSLALSRIHRRTGMAGVRTAEGGEGVTGAMIRARIWVDGRLAGGLQALLGAPMAAYSGCGERDGGIGHGKRRSRTGLARVCGTLGWLAGQ